jgi:hypothetical protein
MKPLVRELLQTAIVAAGLALLLAYVRGWKLGVLIVVLLALYFWPRRDPAAIREQRIEKQATLLAIAIEDWREITTRAMEKMHPRGEELPSAITRSERER